MSVCVYILYTHTDMHTHKYINMIIYTNTLCNQKLMLDVINQD